jgi:hypothetical protein
VLDCADLGAVTAAVVRFPGPGGPELRLRAPAPVDLVVGSVCHIDLDPDTITAWQGVGGLGQEAVPVAAT